MTFDISPDKFNAFVIDAVVDGVEILNSSCAAAPSTTMPDERIAAVESAAENSSLSTPNSDSESDGQPKVVAWGIAIGDIRKRVLAQLPSVPSTDGSSGVDGAATQGVANVDRFRPPEHMLLDFDINSGDENDLADPSDTVAGS